MIQFGPQITRKNNADAGLDLILAHCIGRQSRNIDFDCGDTFIIFVAYNRKKQTLLNISVNSTVMKKFTFNSLFLVENT